MTQELVVEVIRKALMTVLLCSMPMLAVAIVVGIVVSLFQAVTQISEMTLVFVPKIIAVFLAMAIFFPWITNTFLDFCRWIFVGIPAMVR